MKVLFNLEKGSWLDFYRENDVEIRGEPNNDGWVNFPCVLPTHGKHDQGCHGGINIIHGSYKCFSEYCRDSFVHRLQKSPNSQVLTPREFLMLTQSLTPQQALERVESYRLEESRFPHYDEAFTSKFAPPRGLAEWIEVAQTRLHPDLDIVREYCETRQLRYETLVRAGAGYVPEDRASRQIECLILPFTVNGEPVAVRGRTIDGRKGGVGNSHLTLYNLDEIDRTKSQTAIVVEGESDTLFLGQLLRDEGYDVPVFGTPGAHFKIEWRRHLQPYSKVLAVPQTDLAATTFTREIRQAFPEPERLEVLTLPWKPRQSGKDIIDFSFENPTQEVVTLLGLARTEKALLPDLLKPSHLRQEGQREIPWLITNLLERGTKTWIAGEPKTFKTWLALQMAQSVILGCPFLGVEEWTPPQAGLKVLFVEEEGALYRFGQRFEILFPELTDDGTFHALHRRGFRLDNDESFNRLRQHCLEVQPDLLILDPFSFLHSGDENSAQETMKAMSPLNSILRSLPNTAIVLLHHSPKGGKGLRGSGALWAAADVQIGVTRTASGTIKLEVSGRDFPEGSSSSLEFLFDSTLGRHLPSQQIQIAVPSTSRRQNLLNLFEQGPETWFTVLELQNLAGLTSYTTRKILKELVEENSIETRSQKSNRISWEEYKLKDQN